MKIALMGDLHGNMPAVRAACEDARQRHADALYCLGDLVGKGPGSAETMDWALSNCDVVLKGNWDEAICMNLFPQAPWFRAQLGEARIARLSALPFEHRFMFSGRKIRLLHGRPITRDTVYSDSPIEERRALFQTEDGYAPDIVGFADIHRPFYEQINQLGTLFNTGSVGNPLAFQPHPSYAILEGEMGDAWGALCITIVQVPYDRDEAIRQAELSPDLPYKDAFIREVRTGQYSR